MKYSVQMYSLRNEIHNKEDLRFHLYELRKMGFEGVEFAGYYGLDPVTLKGLCDEAGLIITGTHYNMKGFMPDTIDETIAYHKALGLKTIGTGGGPHKTDADADRTALIFEWANKYGADKGVQFYYHTHYTEFEKLESGRLPIDVIKAGALLQIDTYWSFYAGIDTRKFCLDNKDRIISLHIKDGNNGVPCALGEGQCDVAAMIETGKDLGFKWLVLENDDPVPTGLEDVCRSMNWLKAHDADLK